MPTASTEHADILSTFAWEEPTWRSRVDILDRNLCTKPGRVIRIVRAARRYPTLVLDGASRAEQVSAVLVARMRRPPRLVFNSATWKRGRGRFDRLACWLGMRAMDGSHVIYCVLSREELSRFPQTWRVDAERVRLTPFCYTLLEQELEEPTRDDGGVFAGGNSMRDYEPLVEAAALIAPTRVTVATRLLEGRTDLPPNLHAGPVSHARFVELMRETSVVVVPLPGNMERSAGQQTYLNAMALGKLAVVTESPGVRDYIDDGQTGLVVPSGEPVALAEAIKWASAPENAAAVRRIRAQGRTVARERYSRARYVDRLLAVVDGSEGAARLTA